MRCLQRENRLLEEYDRKCLDVMMWIADELARRVEEHMQKGGSGMVDTV